MIIMAEKQKLRAPTGMAGLVKYEDEGESLIKLKPAHVVGIAVSLIILELILFLMIPL
jgi:preprotein translocase subunit Sec61beta